MVPFSSALGFAVEGSPRCRPASTPKAALTGHDGSARPQCFNPAFSLEPEMESNKTVKVFLSGHDSLAMRYG